MSKMIITIGRQFGAGGRELGKKLAEKKIRKMDRLRAAYYNEHADTAWGRSDNYDLCINLSRISLERAVKMIASNCK